jgi:hypothetical protein
VTRAELQARVERLVHVGRSSSGWSVFVGERVIDSFGHREPALMMRDEVIDSVMAALWPAGNA